MSSIITRRSLLRGLFAAPAIVAASSLMPIRGIVMDAAYVIDAPEYTFSPVTLGNIRNMLFPGLFEVRSSFDMIPRQWGRVFAA